MNNFARLSDPEAKFLVRWRGRPEGPYSASLIDAKLAANEIGLLHEVFHEGKWLAIRDYLAEREVVLRAESQALEERVARDRESTERLAREAEEQRQAELLAEDRRQAARLESLQRQQSAQGVPPILATTRVKRGWPALLLLGVLVTLAGLAVTGFFLLAFDTSVENGAGRVNNLGLMADRQNGIIAGVGLGLLGAILLATGSRGRN